MMHSASSVASMKPPETLPAVFDSIAVIFGPPRASFTLGNKNNSGRTKSDNVVACRRQTTGAKYYIGPMEYTGNGSTEVVHFERRFEEEGVLLVSFV